MSKKMTAKEFKQVINDVYGDFDCWGFEGMLNLIAIAEEHLAKDETERGYLLIAQESNRRCEEITAILSERGYYNH